MAILYILLGIAMAFLFGSIDVISGGMSGVPFILGIIFAVIAIAFSLAILVPQTYFEAESSFVLEFPAIEEFDDIEEVKAFLSENF